MQAKANHYVFSKIASFAFFAAFVIFFAAVKRGPTRSLGFAVLYFGASIALLVLCLRDRYRVKYRDGSPAPAATFILMILMFFVLGLCSLGDARGWSFFQQHSLLLRLSSMGIVAACFGSAWLREQLPSARIHGDKRLLGMAAIALIALLAWIGYLWFSLSR